MNFLDVMLQGVDGEILKVGAIGGLTLVCYKALELAGWYMGKRGSHKTPMSGEMPPEFWNAKFDKLATIGQQQTEILKGIAETNAAIERSLAVVLDRGGRV